MKCIMIPAICICLAVLSSCESQVDMPGSCKVGLTSDTVIFKLNQSIPVFTACDTGLTAMVTEINDSRCPANANCVWAGTAYAKLAFSNNFSVMLQLGQPKDTTYEGRLYTFSLVNVLPYPVTDQNTQPIQEAYISIIKK